MTVIPKTMDEVAELMRSSLPEGMSPSEFGRKMDWGRGSDAARDRIASITDEELQEIGLDAKTATNWATAYEAVKRLKPDNPSATGRAELMRRAAKLLGGKT